MIAFLGPLVATMLASTIASKVITGVTGSKELGMIAGAVAGMGLGAAAASGVANAGAGATGGNVAKEAATAAVVEPTVTAGTALAGEGAAAAAPLAEGVVAAPVGDAVAAAAPAAAAPVAAPAASNTGLLGKIFGGADGGTFAQNIGKSFLNKAPDMLMGFAKGSADAKLAEEQDRQDRDFEREMATRNDAGIGAGGLIARYKGPRLAPVQSATTPRSNAYLDELERRKLDEERRRREYEQQAGR